MPIRFRCAYCNQLMGIAHRKAGSVVRCPKCSGQVVVPSLAELEIAAPPLPNPAAQTGVPPAVQGGSAQGSPGQGSPGGGVFEQDDFSRMFMEDSPAAHAARGPSPAMPQRPNVPGQPPVQNVQHSTDYDVEPIAGPIEIRGIFLTPGLLFLAGVLIFILMAAAFFLGWIIGRA